MSPMRRRSRVRLLAPFDPVVWDRRRFALLWGWEYRFEAYTPAAKRQLGYYALPLLYRAQVIGWANLQVREGTLAAELGFVGTQPREAAFRRGLEQELASPTGSSYRARKRIGTARQSPARRRSTQA
jgi:uncharacterized protein YcaQ